ncbi:MAG: ACP S-malonyltransferase [Proteobacteria bacterium]|nr:ACP S-malonyltransferase [Pseudomonadota bacterium]MBU1711004.1 ACP S-malonyltransferase [Pseudomonadota bacterium]
MTDKKTAFIFPGQGSQYLGMAQGFIDADPEAKTLMSQADLISGLQLSTLCRQGPMEELTKALHLQPALTAVDLICWQALLKAGLKPHYVAGHSLGEFSALCAAGVLSVEDTLNLVSARGRLMDREGLKNPGGMRAVLGFTIDEVREVLAGVTKGVVTAANHNMETQIVISGDQAGLDEASAIFDEMGARVIPLNVAIANHSPLVQDAVPDFMEVMKGIEFRPPVIPMLFNVTAKAEVDPEVIREVMARQMSSMVRWLDIMNDFIARDVRVFIEVGPKKVLSGLLRKIVPKGYEHKCFQVDSPETLEECIEGLRN